MDNSLLKKILPHGIAVAVMLVLAFVFFSPYSFDGKVLQQGDNQKASASQAEVFKYYEKTGKPVLWTGAFFSGMPTTQIYQVDKSNFTTPVFNAVLLQQGVTAPNANVWLAMLSMYILLLTWRLDWRLSLMGAIVFGLSSFNMDIIEAGHSTKMVALALAPLVLAGVNLCLRRDYLLGSATTALAIALQVGANHYQITYYLFIVILIWGIFEFAMAVRNKEIVDFGKTVAAITVGIALGVLCNIASVWTTQSYQIETQRGKPNLTTSKNPKEGGVTKQYATDWSYGVGESMTLLMQNACGGGASQTHAETQTYETVSPQILQSMAGVPADKARKEADRQISSLFYTGSQPFVGVSIYWGAISIFLFVMGLFVLEGKQKAWLATASLVMLMIAWGKNFFFFDLMFDYFPLFNKFRSVTQALGLGQMLLVLMGGLTLQAVFDPSVSREKKLKSLYFAAGITSVLCFLGMSLSGGSGKQDAQLQVQLVNLLKEDRSALAQSDAFRSMGLILVSAGLIWAYLNGKIKSYIAVAGIGALTLFDTWTIAKRIIYNEKFETKQEAGADLVAKPVDLKIMEDKDPNFRVLDMRNGNPFQNAQTSMFHKSVGGYHSAKLMIYQEMIDRYLGNFQEKTPIMSQPNLPLFGMLNAKYIIMDDAATGAQINPYALGNAWFAKNIKLVDNADQEIELVGKINPRFDVLMQKSFAEKIGATAPPQYDSSGTITQTSYTPDHIEYASNAAADQIAVFSEIYYPEGKGWTLTVDGKDAPITKANYILRAAKIPAGKHTIVMDYHPNDYYTSQNIGRIASVLTLLLFAGGLFFYFKKNNLSSVDRLAEMDLSVATARKPVTKPIAEQNPEVSVEAKKKLRPKK